LPLLRNLRLPLTPNSSFNPCFRGTCPRTATAGSLGGFVESFQSLFSWNLPSDRTEFSAHRVVFQFQSLFSWNLPSDGRVPVFLCSANASFNPCFRGTCPRTDWSLIIISLYCCFNPCFRGTCPRTSARSWLPALQ